MKENNIEKPSLATLWHDVIEHWKLYCLVLGVTSVLSVIYVISLPNYYDCTVTLASEVSAANKKAGLAGLASTFGVELGNSVSGTDAITPMLYPDLLQSITFKSSLFPIKVHRQDETETFTYYDYLLNQQKAPWWSEAKNAVLSIFKSDEEETTDSLNLFQLTEQQNDVMKMLKEKITCDVDKKTFVLTINVTDQDPLIAATIADSVRSRLQNFIINYHTQKARTDLEHDRKMLAQAKNSYEKARIRYSSYTDANQRVFLERVRSQVGDYENEFQLRKQAYSQLAAQVQMLEAKVQEATPAFTILQPATVPLLKTGPKRGIICIAVFMLALIATTLFIFHREGHLLPFLQSSEPDDYEQDDILRALLKLSAQEKVEKKNE